MTDFSSSRFPILFRKRWNITGLANAISEINLDSLCSEYDALRSAAPRRHDRNKRHFVGHDGRPQAKDPASPAEKHLAIALWRFQTLQTRAGVSELRFLDYQFPLKAARSDAGLGEVDLLGVTVEGRIAIIELKVSRRSSTAPDTPVHALMEGLRYAAVVQANNDAIAAEARDRFGIDVFDRAPIMQILAPEDWWRGWRNMASRTRRAAGRWESALLELTNNLEARLGISAEFASLGDVGLADVRCTACGPRLDRSPTVSSVALASASASQTVLDYAGYERDLRQCLWTWADRHHHSDELDGGGRNDRPPVLNSESASKTVLVPSDPNRARSILAALPKIERHRWFRSLKSSQALAQSVFGAVAAFDRLNLLDDVVAECGRLAFLERTSGASLVLEHRVRTLGEPRSTSVDVLLGGTSRRVAIECKFGEREYGTCSRPKLRSGDSTYPEQHCDGNYRVQRQRNERCALTEIGVRYWTYLPDLFEWEAGGDLIPCPLSPVYQLARNALAATVTGAGIDQESGHVLTVYDVRNPEFAAGGKARRQYDSATAACRIPGLFRRVSWQRVAGALAVAPEFAYLVAGLEAKYGITTE